MYVSLLDSGGDERKHSRVAFIDGFGLAAVFPLCRSLGLWAALSAKSARPVPRRPPRGNWRTLDLLTHSLARIATSGSGVSAGWVKRPVARLRGHMNGQANGAFAQPNGRLFSPYLHRVSDKGLREEAGINIASPAHHGKFLWS